MAVLVRVVKCREFFCGHIGRIEIRTGGTDAVTFHERLVVNTVPRAVIDHGIRLLAGIREILHEGFIPEILLPVNVVGFFRGQFVQLQDLLSVVGNPLGKMGFQVDQGIAVRFFLDLGSMLLVASRHDGETGQRHAHFLHDILLNLGSKKHLL